MSASLKPVLGRQIRGMRHLESKILDLQNQYQSLLKERQQDITALLSMLELVHLDDSVLVGGLLFINEKVTAKDPTGLAQVEAWRDAGEKFLRRAKPKIRPSKCGEQAGNFPRPREHEGKKWAEDFPQNLSEKNTSLKQTATHETTPQPPQKQPQSREK